MKNNKSKFCNRPIILFIISFLFFISSTHSYANIVSVSNQNLTISSNPSDLLSVYSSETIPPLSFHFGLYLDWAINGLPNFETNSQQQNLNLKQLDFSEGGILNSVIDGSIIAGFGLMKDWDVSLFIPMILYQNIKYPDYLHGEYTKKGLLGIGIQSKYSILKINPFGFATVLTFTKPTTEGDFYEGKNTFNISLELVADVNILDFEIAANLGFKYKKADKIDDGSTYLNIDPLSSQILTSAGVGYKMDFISTKVSLEYYGAYPVDKDLNPSNKSLTMHEIILGARTNYNDFNFIYGIGSRLNNSIGSPDFRLFAGLTYSLQTKQDEITPEPEPEQEPEPKQEEEEFVYTEDMVPDETIQLKNINFARNSTELVGDINSSNIDTLAQSLQKGFKFLVIEGHTCNIGTPEYNLELSQKRAETMKQLLVEKYQIPEKKIKAIGYGLTRPIESNDTEKGKITNRRVEFKVFR